MASRRRILAAFGIGAVVTLLSLLNVEHQLRIGPNDYYNYRFPLPWLVHVIISLPSSNSLWIPTIYFSHDLLLWTGVAFLALLAIGTVGKSFVRSD